MELLYTYTCPTTGEDYTVSPKDENVSATYYDSQEVLGGCIEISIICICGQTHDIEIESW